ncbi:MAG: peptidase [Pirellulales bacterium]
MSHDDRTTKSSAASRRSFIKAGTAAALAAYAGPTILGAENKSGSKPAVIGSGEHTYECHHGWGELPDGWVWAETHGVAIDEEGLVYIKHRSKTPEPVDAIGVFDADGKFVRSFGKEYHQGGHGIDIRKENAEEFLYLCDVFHGVTVKTNLLGEHVWEITVPQEPGVYQPDTKYSPTNVAFAPDGGFYIADGYGAHYIHQYDKNAKWVRTWGGEGSEPGKMKTPHGLWLDNRPGREAELVVADRANARLQYFTLDGQFLRIVEGVSFPAHFDIRGSELLVPDLHARVTIMDRENQPIIHLGYDPEWTKLVLDDMKFTMRGQPARWENGRFIHPHDACFDKEGNIFVVEWVPTGRVTKLKKVG